MPRLTGGYVGVDVFFVLSGFLITGLLLREATATGTVSISGFYARRARRILPASLLVILATVVASVVLLNFVRAGQVLSDARWATAFMANLHFAATGTDYLQADVPPRRCSTTGRWPSRSSSTSSGRCSCCSSRSSRRAAWSGARSVW
nr:acyltransferase [Angustibacter aerolatus]